jgi:hypothetical protein
MKRLPKKEKITRHVLLLLLFLFSVSPLANADTMPDPFTFNDITDAEPYTVYESNLITISGIDSPSPVSITGGEYCIYHPDGSTSPWTSEVGTVENGDRVWVRLISSDLLLGTKNAKLTIGGVSDTFSVTTASNPRSRIIPYPSFLEEFPWTYGCTPTAASMVLSYWDTSHWDSVHRMKFVGMGRLIDYYYWHQCGTRNVPNVIHELAGALETDYADIYCSGDGGTYPWRIDDGIRYVTNNLNGYEFLSTTDCSTVWPDLGGDWCWDSIKGEIDNDRPFVWSTGDLDWSGTSGHSVAAWGYTSDKYVIVYNTWGDGRQEWYYSHYLNDSGNSIQSAQVNLVIPPPPSQRSDSDIVLDDPNGDETLFVGTTHPIWWYMWGTQIRTVKIYLSYDWGQSWSLLATVNPPHTDMWGSYNWVVPNPPRSFARIRIEAFDGNDNYVAGDGSFKEFGIINDTTPPTGSIVINGGAAYTNNPAVTLTLSCVDDPADASGCADMRFSNDNANWTLWEAYASSKAWTLTDSDGAKAVYVDFRDKVGNISGPRSDSITLDRTGPQVTMTINGGALYTTTPSVTINISCSQCVQMHFVETDYGYNGAWTNWEPYNPAKAWVFVSQPANGRVGVYAEFKDALGNSSWASDQIILDTLAPGGSILINNNAIFTNTASVILDLECYDYQSGCSVMRFSNDNITWSNWEPFNTTKAWTLSGGDGNKTVYVQYKDNVSYTSAIIPDTIMFETVPPAGTISINSGESSTNSTFATLTLSCNDPASGCSEMRFSNDGSTWSLWEPFATSKAWALSSGNGTKRVYIQFKDTAGNMSTFSDTIVLETLFLLSTIDAALTPGYSSIAVDSNNKVHISSPGGALRYVTNASGSWIVTFVDKTANYSSIALDSNGAAHISYYESTNKVLKYAANLGGIWSTTTVDSSGDVGWYSSVAVDSNNKAHIAYYDSTNADLRYATNASGSWVISTIDSTGDVGKYCSIGLDSSNRVHISYHDATNYDLKYATNASGTWVNSILESYNTLGAYTSLAVDWNNKVHISYRGDVSGTNLKYITNASGSWVAATVETTRGDYSSIAVDSGNKAYIVYYDSTNYKLKYATNNSGSWVSSAIENAGNLPSYPAIALDSTNKAHICYFDTNTSGTPSLNYAHNTSGLWTISTVESAANPIGRTSIAVDANGKIHMSYLYAYRYRDPILLDWGTWYGLKYATNASGLWIKTIIDNGSYTAGSTSIGIDSSNRVHISYYKHVRYPDDHRFLYTTNSSGSWVISTLESSTTDYVGYYSSLAVDKNDKLHIGYGSSTSGPLKYATNASGSWVISPITTATGTEISLALDSAGKVHIAYGQYATNASGSWAIQPIETQGGNYPYPSIAVDSNDRIHISHVYFSGYPTSFGALKYANNVSGSWSLSTIDNTGNAWNTAIKTDSKDRAHIVYFDILGLKLKYATNAAGVWHASTVDDDGDTGRDPSMVIDANDTIHIGYIGGGLRYGRSPDTRPPVGSIVINNGVTYTNQTSVTLTLSAADPGFVTQMCVSNTPSCSAWELYAISRSWTLSPLDGVKTVYAWFKDTNGNANAIPYSDAIILDATPPTGSLVINGGDSYTNTTSVILTISGVDTGSGISQMCISNTPSCSSWESYTPTKQWTILPGEGPRTVYVWLRDGAGNTSATPYSDTIQCLPKNKVDFNGDQKTDILWRHATSGTVAIWLMNGASISSASVSGTIDGGWQIRGIGDFDGDGKADILWQHAASGTVAIWIMNGVAIASVGVPGVIPSDWQIKGVGDFDGDRKTDILWQHVTSGTVAIWLMNGVAIASVGVPGVIPSDWQIKGVGDFDGNGKADVLWQHTSSGTIAVWMMNGVTIGSVGVPGVIGADWQIKGVGDFDGDGKTDILWQHAASGTVAIWTMNGTGILSVGVPGVISNDWQIKEIGDFDGDGRADILWQHTASGMVAVWMMNGLAIASVGVPGVISSEWQIMNR